MYFYKKTAKITTVLCADAPAYFFGRFDLKNFSAAVSCLRSSLQLINSISHSSVAFAGMPGGKPFTPVHNQTANGHS
jgi:hypothetical protein